MFLIPTAALSFLQPFALSQFNDFHTLLSSAYGLGKKQPFDHKNFTSLTTIDESFKEFSSLKEQHPWINQRLHCGEDSFFFAPDTIGVADGVGGWTEYGVDPSKISNQLMKNCLEETFNQKAKSPKKLLITSYNR